MNSRNKAFTLVEILMALVILGVGVTALFSLFAVGAQSVRRSLAYAQASMAAQCVMEYYSFTGYYSGMDNLANIQPLPPFVDEYTDGTYTITVQSPDQVVGLNNRLVRIRLNIQGNGINEDFHTYIATY